MASGLFYVTCTYNEDQLPKSPLCQLGLVTECVRQSLAEIEAPL